MTTYRTQWTPPGSIGPRWHDFWAKEAAEHWADILRTNGHHHVTTHDLNSTEETQP